MAKEEDGEIPLGHQRGFWAGELRSNATKVGLGTENELCILNFFFV